MMKSKSTSELIEYMLEGKESAFNELYRRYHKLVYYIAYEMCRNDADAQDVLQETFIQIRKSITSLHDPKLFKPWMNRIVVNKCKNLFRSRKHVELDVDGIWYQQQLKEDRRYLLPKEKLHFENDQEVVRYYLNLLNDSQRIALFLYYFNEMSIKEIAELLETPEGTIKTRMMYGKQNLKKLIQAYEIETDTKVNFHMDGLAIASCFAYFYHKQPRLSVHGGRYSKFTSCIMSNTLSSMIIFGLSSVVAIAGYQAFQAYQEKGTTDVNNQTQYNIQTTNDKKYYFELLDWACCEDDMRKKTKEEFDLIMPIYQAMKESNSAYLERLKRDYWINNFEAVYQEL